MINSYMILVGIMCGLLTMFLNYCIGKPSSPKFSPYEIFSFYTIWLVKHRLKKIGLYYEYVKQFGYPSKSAFLNTPLHARITRKHEAEIVMYNAAEPFFTWERAAGMCPVCFGVWVSVICGFFFIENIIDLLIIVITSHATIRIFNKIVYD